MGEPAKGAVWRSWLFGSSRLAAEDRYASPILRWLDRPPMRISAVALVFALFAPSHTVISATFGTVGVALMLVSIVSSDVNERMLHSRANRYRRGKAPRSQPWPNRAASLISTVTLYCAGAVALIVAAGSPSVEVIALGFVAISLGAQLANAAISRRAHEPEP